MWYEHDSDKAVSRLAGMKKQAPTAPTDSAPVVEPGTPEGFCAKNAARPEEEAKEETEESHYDYLENSASASDMTGLMYAAPQNEAQAASYDEVYHYLPPNADATQLK